MDSKEKKQLARQRREAARQAQKFHKEQGKQNKQNKKSSAKPKKKATVSKIKEAVNQGKVPKYENITREEKFRRESEEKLRNLQPHDFEDGYYIDEYSEKKRAEKRAKEIRKQEVEIIHRNKKPMTSSQVRRRRILISAGIVAAVVVIGVILSFTVLFKTKRIDIEGDEYYSREQIEAFGNVSLQQNIFIGAMNSTPQDIVDNLPYVESAKISFAIPDTITIKIKNAERKYAIKDGNNYLVVSSKGRILDDGETSIPEGLIELKCGDIDDKSVGSYINFGDGNVSKVLETLAKSFEDNEVKNITSIDISDLTEIVVNYDNRIDIVIGTSDDIDYKIKTAVTIIDEKLDPNGVGTITGTLDVSTCNKNQTSRYKPNPTQPVTIPPTTEANSADGSGGSNAYDNGDYNAYDNGGYNAYDNGGYNAYDNGDYNVYDNGIDNNVYDDGGAVFDGGGGYDENAYSPYAE